MTTRIIRIELAFEEVSAEMGKFVADLHDAICDFVVANGFSSKIKNVSTGIIKINDIELPDERNFN